MACREYSLRMGQLWWGHVTFVAAEDGDWLLSNMAMPFLAGASTLSPAAILFLVHTLLKGACSQPLAPRLTVVVPSCKGP